MADDNINHFLKEWEATRAVLKTFDDHLHDLRKYGFSFFTALLAGSSILFTTWVIDPIPAGQNGFVGEPFPEHIKAAVLGVTLLLIFGLFTIDIYYRLFQRSANIRSRILEKVLNIELSDTITQRYDSSAYQKIVVSAVYSIFIYGVVVLGIFVLSNSLLSISLGLLGTVFFVLVVALSWGHFFIHYERGTMDWILDRLECKVGDEVRIIMTNISDEDYRVGPEEVVWKLFKEGESRPLRSGFVPAGIVIPSFHNFMWEIKTEADKISGREELAPGIYRIDVKPLQKESWPKPKDEMIQLKPLSRKLRTMSPGKTPVHHVKFVKNTRKT